MWFRTLARWALAMFVFAGNAAFGQERVEHWEFEITPRFWYLVVNPTPFIDSPLFQQTNEDAEFPMYGFSLRVAPPNFTKADFLLTFFRGSDSVKGRSIDAFGNSSRHVTDATRTDVELLYRRRIPESNARWFAGVRWVLFEEDSRVDPGFVFPASGTDRLEEETNFYLGEIGVSFSTPLDLSAKHLLFGNFTTGFGYESQVVENRGTSASPDNDGFFPFIDANIGYQYVLTESLSFHVRYRTFVLREVVRDQIVALHGPEVGIGFLF